LSFAFLAALEPTNKFYRMNFVNVQNRVFFYKDFPYYDEVAEALLYRNFADDGDDAVRGIVLVDFDGSITGTCGAQIVGAAGPLLRHRFH
jgi:hypothetical protein